MENRELFDKQLQEFEMLNDMSLKENLKVNKLFLKGLEILRQRQIEQTFIPLDERQMELLKLQRNVMEGSRKTKA